MTTDFPRDAQIPGLRTLWKEAFGDEDSYLDSFYAHAYSPSRCLCTGEGDRVAAALYWFPCTLEGQPIAYIYAVASAKACRRQGLGSRLMVKAHQVLAQAGYAGAILMPAEKGLFSFYERLGYRTATGIDRFSCAAGESGISVTPLSSQEYGALRRKLLPAGSVIQEGPTLRFLETQVRFCKGPGFLLCYALDAGVLTAQEYLGDPALAPGILRTLGLSQGNFRTPGNSVPFTMYLPFRDGPVPAYFGLPMD